MNKNGVTGPTDKQQYLHSTSYLSGHKIYEVVIT
jgi:hypothetical protein